MVRKWQLKEKARDLRKKGLSYKEIIQKVPVCKSTISLWCRDIELTDKQLARIGSLYDRQCKGARANQLKRQKEIKQIKKEAKKEINTLGYHSFKIAGAMLYWAEGSKSNGVAVTNSDPELIRFMMKWFRKICKISNERFKAHLHLHTGLNEEKAKKHWSKITKIPLKQFGKSYFKKEGTGHRKNKLYNGTLRIYIGSEDLRHKILGWIEKIHHI